MIQYPDHTIEYEREDFISDEEWFRYKREENTPGAAFCVKPDIWKNRKHIPRSETVVGALGKLTMKGSFQQHDFERLQFDEQPPKYGLMVGSIPDSIMEKVPLPKGVGKLIIGTIKKLTGKAEIGDFRLDYNRQWGLGEHIYEVGNIVSRNGSDEHIILEIDYRWMTLKVKCIKSPPDNYCQVGEEEDNLIRRYEFLRKSR